MWLFKWTFHLQTKLQKSFSASPARISTLPVRTAQGRIGTRVLVTPPSLLSMCSLTWQWKTKIQWATNGIWNEHTWEIIYYESEYEHWILAASIAMQWLCTCSCGSLTAQRSWHQTSMQKELPSKTFQSHGNLYSTRPRARQKIELIRPLFRELPGNNTYYSLISSYFLGRLT